MSLNIKKYGNTFLIKSVDGFEIEFDTIKIDQDDKEIVFYYENNVTSRIEHSIDLYNEITKFMEQRKKTK